MMICAMDNTTLEQWRYVRRLKWSELAELVNLSIRSIESYRKKNQFPVNFAIILKGIEMIEIEQGKKFIGSLK